MSEKRRGAPNVTTNGAPPDETDDDGFPTALANAIEDNLTPPVVRLFTTGPQLCLVGRSSAASKLGRCHAAVCAHVEARRYVLGRAARVACAALVAAMLTIALAD